MTPPSPVCPGIGFHLQKRQLRPRKVRLVSQDHIAPKDVIDKAIYIEKSNVLMVFCFPACPCSLAAGLAPWVCKLCGRSGPGCRKPHSDCSTAVVWSCWSFYLDFVLCMWSEGGNGACAGGAKLTTGPLPAASPPTHGCPATGPSTLPITHPPP